MTKHPTHEAHPIADIFPMLDDDELNVLAADIKQHGLRQPIVLDGEGRVLDGRNRLAACAKARVTPTFTTYDGDAAELFIISANVHRRHLTTGQRAMATALALTSLGKRRRGRWVRGSVPADTSGSGSSWAQRMAEAGLVIDHTPEFAADVVSGKLRLSTVLIGLEHHRADRALGEQGAADREEEQAVAPPVAENDAAARDTRVSRESTKPAPPRDSLNPVQRRERRAARDAVDEAALAAIAPLCALIYHLDADLHDAGLASLDGKARVTLHDDLKRLGVTLVWSLRQLNGEASP